MIGIVGVVAPGPGSRVRARTSGPEVGRPDPSNTAVPALPTVKLPSGTGAARPGDHPGRVDLAARGRRERLHRDGDLTRGTDGRQPGAGPAVRGQDRGQRPWLGGHLEHGRDPVLVRPRGVELDAEQQAQPTERDDGEDRGDAQQPGAGRGPSRATRVALFWSREGDGRGRRRDGGRRGHRLGRRIARGRLRTLGRRRSGGACGEVLGRGRHDPRPQPGRRLHDRHALGEDRQHPAELARSRRVARLHVARCARTAASSAGSRAPSTKAPASSRTSSWVRSRMASDSLTPTPLPGAGAWPAGRGASGS